eukprot:6312765-Amphidinium_carterae.1
MMMCSGALVLIWNFGADCAEATFDRNGLTKLIPPSDNWLGIVWRQRLMRMGHSRVGLSAC